MRVNEVSKVATLELSDMTEEDRHALYVLTVHMESSVQLAGRTVIQELKSEGSHRAEEKWHCKRKIILEDHELGWRPQWRKELALSCKSMQSKTKEKKAHKEILDI